MAMNKAQKQEFLKQSKAHFAADMLLKGTYGKEAEIRAMIADVQRRLAANRRIHDDAAYLQRRLTMLKAWLIATEMDEERKIAS